MATGKRLKDICPETYEKLRLKYGKPCKDCGTILDDKGCPLCDGRIK